MILSTRHTTKELDIQQEGRVEVDDSDTLTPAHVRAIYDVLAT